MKIRRPNDGCMAVVPEEYAADLEARIQGHIERVSADLKRLQMSRGAIEIRECNTCNIETSLSTYMMQNTGWIRSWTRPTRRTRFVFWTCPDCNKVKNESNL